VTQVLVVGAGIAGTAAALSAARAGATVTVVAPNAGATRFAGGALDLSPWEERARVTPLGVAETHVLDALGAFIATAEEALVATLAGILRPARCIDRALLDLAPLHDGEIVVPSVDWPSWDGAALARAWSCAPEALARRLVFVPLAVPLVRRLEERDLGDADMAELHDAPERLEWLGARLANEIGARRPVAILLPPWLGVEHSRAAALSVRVGVPCGEALVDLAGPSGLRFERARDRALRVAGVVRTAERVASIVFDGRWRAELESGDLDGKSEVDSVVLATGGLVGGGLAYCPSESILATELPPSAARLLRATVEGPLLVGVRGLPLEAPSSLFGAAPESHAWPFVEDSLLENAGVLVDDSGRVRAAPAGLFAAGDVVADRPRTWLSALSSGARAGALAAGVGRYTGV
jgi:glycerol-3-phosphate dehydrogenase subunit B